jgi:hypothetical protein
MRYSILHEPPRGSSGRWIGGAVAVGIHRATTPPEGKIERELVHSLMRDIVVSILEGNVCITGVVEQSEKAGRRTRALLGTQTLTNTSRFGPCDGLAFLPVKFTKYLVSYGTKYWHIVGSYLVY